MNYGNSQRVSRVETAQELMTAPASPLPCSASRSPTYTRPWYHRPTALVFDWSDRSKEAEPGTGRWSLMKEEVGMSKRGRLGASLLVSMESFEGGYVDRDLSYEGEWAKTIAENCEVRRGES